MKLMKIILAVLLAVLTGSLCLRVQAYQQRTAGTATAVLLAEAGFYQKLNAAAPVRLLVVGDSIAEPMDPTGWAPRLRERLRREYGSQAEIVNVSLGGNISYAGYVRTMLRPETQFDLAIVCFGKILLVDRWMMGNEEITVMVDFVVCLALCVTVIVAKVVGCMLPMAAKAMKLDPAVMASPFITTIVDALSLLVYFLFARMLLGV